MLSRGINKIQKKIDVDIIKHHIFSKSRFFKIIQISTDLYSGKNTLEMNIYTRVARKSENLSDSVIIQFLV